MPHRTTDDCFYIDTNNDIHVSVKRAIDALIGTHIYIQLGTKRIGIPVHELHIVRNQNYIMSGRGIPRTNSEDVYDILSISDIIVDITLV
jgi:hypothetical protein